LKFGIAGKDTDHFHADQTSGNPARQCYELVAAATRVGLQHDIGGRHFAQVSDAKRFDQQGPGKGSVNGIGIENEH